MPEQGSGHLVLAAEPCAAPACGKDYGAVACLVMPSRSTPGDGTDFHLRRRKNGMSDSHCKSIFIACWKLLPTWGAWLAAIPLLTMIERASAPPFPLDRLGLAVAQGFRSDGLDGFFRWISWTGSLALLIPATACMAVYLTRQHRCGDAWLLGLGLAGASLLANLAKPLFQRERPDLFPAIVEFPLDASYPSGHAAQSFAFALSLYRVWRPHGHGGAAGIGSVLSLWAMAVACSRIYLQVHFPSDVVGGAVVGLLWAWGLHNLLRVMGITGR